MKSFTQDIFFLNCPGDVTGTPIGKQWASYNHTTTLKLVMYIDLPSTCLFPMGLPASRIRFAPFLYVYIFAPFIYIFTELGLKN